MLNGFVLGPKSSSPRIIARLCLNHGFISLFFNGVFFKPKGYCISKSGTVTNDIKKAVTDAKSGQAEIRNDKDGNIGLSIGKKSFSDSNLIKNYNAIIETLEKEKSNNTLKGDLIKSTFITSSMGVSYKIKLQKNI
mgnify:CR=1 FL=1